MTPEEKTTLKLGIGRIPEILLDTTDRNRTSPFAFTGNRFEFRAAGSSSNCAASMIAINAAMANQLNEFRASVEKLMEDAFPEPVSASLPATQIGEAAAGAAKKVNSNRQSSLMQFG